MTPVIEIIDVHKVYDTGAVKVPALGGVSLTVEHGEFMAIMGASGSGKSTLMNIIGCLDRPTSGRYLLDGEDVSQMNRKQLARVRNKKLGFICQSFNLLKRVSALENVMMPLLYAGVSARLRQERALEVLHLVGLGERANHLPNQLSGGQMQRVAIARALVNEPATLLADEPTGNLDSKTGAEIMVEFQRLNRDLGLTIILVTHDAGVAEQTARVVTLKDGLVESDVHHDSKPQRKPETRNLKLETRM